MTLEMMNKNVTLVMQPSRGWRNRRGRRTVIRFLGVFLLVCGLAQTPSPAQAPETLRIYLARHGETDWNAQGRLQGQSDIPLNTKGREQAALLGKTLQGIRIAAVYSSTLSRSQETAQIVGVTAPLKSLDGLREQHRGRFQGMLNTDPEFVRRSRDPNDALDGGESLNQLTERARVTLGQIRKEHPSGNVLIVGHSVTNQMILRVLLNLPVEQAAAIDQANDELYVIELDPGSGPRLWKLVRENNLGDL
jgi:broad specificity phosphatase PhoE